MFTADEIVPDANLDAPGIAVGGKRKHTDCRSHVIQLYPLILIRFSAISAHNYVASGFVTAILIS